MLFEWMAPAEVNVPAAITSPLASAARARTQLLVPLPSADQAVPLQRATLLAAMPPAVVTPPPATTSPVASTVRPLTVAKPPTTPPPIADHVPPFQRAMLLAALPPAVVKLPPA